RRRRSRRPRLRLRRRRHAARHARRNPHPPNHRRPPQKRLLRIRHPQNPRRKHPPRPLTSRTSKPRPQQITFRWSADHLNLRVPHVSRLLRYVGSYDPLAQSLVSVLSSSLISVSSVLSFSLLCESLRSQRLCVIFSRPFSSPSSFL